MHSKEIKKKIQTSKYNKTQKVLNVTRKHLWEWSKSSLLHNMFSLQKRNQKNGSVIEGNFKRKEIKHKAVSKALTAQILLHDEDKQV